MIKLDPKINKSLKSIEYKLNQFESSSDFMKTREILDSVIKEFGMLVGIINDSFQKLTMLQQKFDKQKYN